MSLDCSARTVASLVCIVAEGGNRVSPATSIDPATKFHVKAAHREREQTCKCYEQS